MVHRNQKLLEAVGLRVWIVRHAAKDELPVNMLPGYSKEKIGVVEKRFAVHPGALGVEDGCTGGEAPWTALPYPTRIERLSRLTECPNAVSGTVRFGPALAVAVNLRFIHAKNLLLRSQRERCPLFSRNKDLRSWP